MSFIYITLMISNCDQLMAIERKKKWLGETL